MLKRRLPTPEERQQAFVKNLEKAKKQKPRPALKTKGKRAKRNASKLKATGHVKSSCCQRCGSTQQLADHHIRHRNTNPCLISEPENLITLCNGPNPEGLAGLSCHDFAHKYQFDFDLWIDITYPGRLERLDEIEQSLTKTPRRTA